MAQREGKERMICVAAVAAAHGVRGALKLRSFTEAPEGVAAYGPVCDGAGNELFELEVLRPAKGGVIAKAAGIDDRDAAEALRGVRLYVPRSRLPEPEEDEFYHEDLVGLDAVSPNGEVMGKVAAIFDFGAGDVLEIAMPTGKTMDLPFTREVVPMVDLASGRVVVVPPEGLTPQGAVGP
jgi:16S rRNA processing protein RimM